MLESSCGRKVDDAVSKFFTHESPSDKCVCTVSLTDESGDSGGVVRRCGAVINGKNATNLKNHILQLQKPVQSSLLTMTLRSVSYTAQMKDIGSDCGSSF
jgi:hypothetical protein